MQLKVLVVEDDLGIRELLEFSLSLEGYEVTGAGNGAEALELIRSRRPDVVLLDVMMPVLDGYEVLEQVRADAMVRATPVIILSAKAGDGDLWRGWNLGVDSYITKPLDVDVLLEEIERVTAMRRVYA